MKKIELIQDTIDNNDIDLLISWLQTYPQLTKGPQTVKFEEKWSKWLGCKHSVFVNSGSSANLLMLYCLKTLNRLKNNKICVPSLCWATDLAPVMQLGMEPILVDCNLQNLSVDLHHLEKLFKEENPSSLMLVSVLGLSPDMDAIVALCNKYDVILLEDNCESQGTEYKGTKLGNFGLMSSFSTYFAHTMSTIEGGMISTNDTEIYHTLLQLRSHGWDRDLPVATREELRKTNDVDEFNSLYTFYLPGFNLRATDVQAYLGINQLDKVDDMVSKRHNNFKYFKKQLGDKLWFPTDLPNTYTSSFAIPVICVSKEQRSKLVQALKDNNIAYRPLISGQMGNQPFYKNVYGSHLLPNCTKLEQCGLYVPNHDKLSTQDIDLICKLIFDYR